MLQLTMCTDLIKHTSCINIWNACANRELNNPLHGALYYLVTCSNQSFNYLNLFPQAWQLVLNFVLNPWEDWYFWYKKLSTLGAHEHQCSQFLKYLKIIHLCFKQSSHLFHKYIHMSSILMRSFGKSCIVFWPTGKKQIYGYV
jgi:hypothetical protein